MNARGSFDGLAIVLHWLVVMLILGVVISALLHSYAQDGVTASLTLLAHRSLGMAIWLLTAFRLIWRLTGASLPPFSESMGRAHRLAVRMSEYGLYALLLAQPLTGLAQTLLRGRAFDLFAWRIPALLDKNRVLTDLFHQAHQIGAYCLIALASLHAVAALIHYFVLRDDVLQTMAPTVGRRR